MREIYGCGLFKPRPSAGKRTATMPFVEIDFTDLEFYECLGSGAAGTVYRSLWKLQNKVVAVKKMLRMEMEVAIVYKHK